MYAVVMLIYTVQESHCVLTSIQDFVFKQPIKKIQIKKSYVLRALSAKINEKGYGDENAFDPCQLKFDLVSLSTLRGQGMGAGS